MYEYLGACLIGAIVWLVLYAYREDLRKPMIWSGIAYIIINLIAFLLLKIVSVFYYLPPIIPDYWDPQTLFNLGRITGGLAIEDILFMFIAGGMATALYEELFRKRIKSSKKKDHHFFALFVSVIATLLFSIVVPLNPIYAIIIFGFAGAFTIWMQRKDLILHSIYGGLAFTFVYFILFLFF